MQSNKHVALLSSIVILLISLSFTLAYNGEGSRARIFVLTDISNEPDDQESLIRLLLHADQYVVEGIVTTTSYWLNDTTYPEQVIDVIAAYENVTENLGHHSDAKYPSAEYLRSKVKTSHNVYGLAALNQGNLSSGAELLISAVDSLTKPLYIQLWGGATVLAEALHHVQKTRSEKDLDIFVSRLRVYSISDQDDAGPWIRQQYPNLRMIVSLHGFNIYGLAAWTGISGDNYYKFDYGGPDSSLVSKSYIAENFQLGPLGSKYPTPAFIMEGDSPSLLYTMQNGLNMPEHPEYGGWGGRYTLLDISGRSSLYSDTVDWVVGKNNVTYASNHATIWRWRSAYQNEMAARVQWSMTPNYADVVHPPKVVVNSTYGYAPLELNVAPSQEISLDASGSIDPDTNSSSSLSFEWMHYREVSSAKSPNWSVDAVVPQLNFTCLNLVCSRIETTMPTVDLMCSGNTTSSCQTYHVILSVTNKGSTPLTRYKRILFQPRLNSTSQLA